jgi:hypothetical protein
VNDIVVITLLTHFKQFTDFFIMYEIECKIVSLQLFCVLILIMMCLFMGLGCSVNALLCLFSVTRITFS